MNATTQRFRDITQDGANVRRLFSGLATGERIELTEGHYLPSVWPAVKRLADLVNSDFTVIGSGGDGKSGESTAVQAG